MLYCTKILEQNLIYFIANQIDRRKMIFSDKRICQLFVVMLLLISTLTAQNRKFTFAGIGIGIQTDRIGLQQDSNTLLKSRWTTHSVFSFSLRQEINRRFSIASGIRLNQLKLGFKFSNDDSGYKIPAMSTLQIPLQFQFIHPLIFGIPEFQLGVSAGIVCDIPINTPSDGILNGFIGSDIQNSYFKTNYHYNSNISWLGELGILGNVMFGKGTTLWLGVFSTFGTQERGITQVVYKTKEMITASSGGYNNTGISLSVQVGFQYPISRWWQPSFYESKQKPIKRNKRLFE